MRLVSWNVNGIRAVLKKDFLDIFDMFNADVFALQETKCQVGQVKIELPGYYQFWSAAERKGYSGTAVFSKQQPRQVLHGLGSEYLDAEGRICALEFDDFWFVDVYTPNAQNELARIGHRMEWDDAFRDFCKGLEEGSLPGEVLTEVPAEIEAAAATGEETPERWEPLPAQPKPVVMCGDFNVAHQEIDLKNPGPNRGKAGFSDEERGKFTDLLEAGFTDTFRSLHPDATGCYSWWSYRFKARENNAGWRIDYFLTSNEVADKIVDASIHNEVFGSDHCPVSLDIEW